MPFEQDVRQKKEDNEELTNVDVVDVLAYLRTRMMQPELPSEEKVRRYLDDSPSVVPKEKQRVQLPPPPPPKDVDAESSTSAATGGSNREIFSKAQAEAIFSACAGLTLAATFEQILNRLRHSKEFCQLGVGISSEEGGGEDRKQKLRDKFRQRRKKEDKKKK